MITGLVFSWAGVSSSMPGELSPPYLRGLEETLRLLIVQIQLNVLDDRSNII